MGLDAARPDRDSGAIVQAVRALWLIAALLLAGCCPCGYARFTDRLGTSRCVAPAPDTGKSCRSSDDCHYRCTCTEDRGSLIGRCSRYPPEPGHAMCLVENGRITGIIVD